MPILAYRKTLKKQNKKNNRSEKKPAKTETLGALPKIASASFLENSRGNP